MLWRSGRGLACLEVSLLHASGSKLDALQNWEQGRRRPDGAARALLRVIERESEAVLRALAGSWLD